MPVATGQFTIIDYNDALTLTGFITSNLQKTQMYNPDNASYTPDWSKTNLVLTPSLYKLGTTDDIITSPEVTSVTWYKIENGTEVQITSNSPYSFSGTKSHILIVKSNVMAGLPGIDFVCKVIYHDTTTNLDLVHKIPISFTRVVNGGGITDAIAWAPDGNVFKNDKIQYLTAQCDLWRGSVIDTTQVEYKWFARDSKIFAPKTLASNANSGATSITLNDVSGIEVGEYIVVGTANQVQVTGVNTTTKVVTLSAGLSSAQSSGAQVKHYDYDPNAGAGWRYLRADIANKVTGVNTNKITIYNEYVTNQSTFMCIIRDTDTSSNTYDRTFKDTVTFVDQSDPIQITIESTGGDVFKNGVGSTVLTARLFRNGEEIDASGARYTYKWYKYDKDGNLVDNFGGAGIAYKTGKTLNVGGADVDVKATFKVEVS